MDTQYYLIPLLLLVPLLSAAGITRMAREHDDQIRAFAAISSLIVFVISLGLLLAFDFDRSGQIQLTNELPWIDSFGLTFRYGIDSISLWLVLLTTFLMPLVILGSFKAVKERVREFYFWLLLLEAAMIGVFVAVDIIFFYICFEFTLVPLYFLIGVFGSSQRLKAAKMFFMYTFTGSMLTFAGVLYVAWWHSRQFGTWTFAIRPLITAATDPIMGMNAAQQAWVMAAMLAGFAVKVPLFPVHTWLPLAHTEAPTAGSVVLAGVLLKLGTYALVRLAIPMAPEAAVTFAPYIALLATIGIVYAALICWVQQDIKKLIAYSSVSHLGFCVLGMFALNAAGISGSVIYMINHGLSTGALFLLVGMIYERLHTREMSQMQGLGRVMPVWSFFMVFFCLASVGLPGLNGFVGEFLTLLGSFTSPMLGPVYAGVAGLGLIFGAIYILYMVGRVVWGPVKLPEEHGSSAAHGHGAGHGHHGVADLSMREIAVLVPLALSCLWLGLYPNCVLKSLDAPVAAIVQQTDPEQRMRRMFPPPPMDPSYSLEIHTINPANHVESNARP